MLISAVQQNDSDIYIYLQETSEMPETSEMQVLSLSWEDPLEEGLATHSSILVWSIP